MKPKYKIVFDKSNLIYMIFLFSLFFNGNGILLAQDIEPNKKPLDVKLEAIDFIKSLNTFDLDVQIQANTNLIDFRTEIQCASFVELIGIEGNEINSFAFQQKNQLKFKYKIHQNSSFKIKAVFTGVQLPDSTKFTQIEFYISCLMEMNLKRLAILRNI